MPNTSGSALKVTAVTWLCVLRSTHAHCVSKMSQAWKVHKAVSYGMHIGISRAVVKKGYYENQNNVRRDLVIIVRVRRGDNLDGQLLYSCMFLYPRVFHCLQQHISNISSADESSILKTKDTPGKTFRAKHARLLGAFQNAVPFSVVALHFTICSPAEGHV